MKNLDKDFDKYLDSLEAKIYLVNNTEAWARNKIKSFICQREKELLDWFLEEMFTLRQDVEDENDTSPIKFLTWKVEEKIKELSNGTDGVKDEPRQESR